MQQTLDVRLIRKPFGCGEFVCDCQINSAQADADMSRLRSCEQTANGTIPLLFRDFRNVAEVDFFIWHCSESFEFFFLLLSWHSVFVRLYAHCRTVLTNAAVVDRADNLN